MKKILFIIISTIFFTGCKKEDVKPIEKPTTIYVRLATIHDADTTFFKINIIKMK